MITLRDARLEDVEAIRAIERAAAGRFDAIGMGGQGLDEPSSPEEVAKAIAAGEVIVACDGAGPPVGFITFHEVDGCAYVAEIDVLPSHAGRRIGGALIDEVDRRAATIGLRGLTLSTFRDVPWNAPYYRRLGFIDIPDAALGEALLAIRAEHVGRGLDETKRTFMQRPLTPNGGVQG
ncbi:MAG TPA: GNAT family N-acetyltransferase [Caulobacteraceae bacterium]|jgi:predicted N-acetyltransferase YhbS|nr:GNAT family N-acetyltransferase [Caulobacteraceae bacterium]